jgi:hypothetical protein
MLKFALVMVAWTTSGGVSINTDLRFKDIDLCRIARGQVMQPKVYQGIPISVAECVAMDYQTKDDSRVEAQAK